MTTKKVFSITAPTPRMRDRCLNNALKNVDYGEDVNVKNFFEACSGELLEIFFNMQIIFCHDQLWDIVVDRYNKFIDEVRNDGQGKITIIIPSPFEIGMYFSGVPIHSHYKKPIMQLKESQFNLDACFYFATRMDYNKFFESVNFDPPLLESRFRRYFTQFRHILYGDQNYGFPLIKLLSDDKAKELNGRLNSTLKRKF